MSDSVQLHRWQPTRLPRPWDSPGKNTGVGCHFLLQCVKVKSEKWKVKVKSLSRVRLLTTPWTAAYQAPPPMGFSRQEYWSKVPRIVKFIETESMWVNARGQEVGSVGREFQLRKVKNPGDGWWWELHNNANVLSAIKTYGLIWLE